MAVIVAMVLLQGLDTDVRSYVRYQVNMLTTTIATPKALPEAAVLEAALLDAGVLDSAPILASPGKNLVLIYLEGLEATYLDQSLFGNVLPALNSTQQEAIAFTNMIQTAGTGYTIAGIVASQCGTPMLFNATSTDPNDFLYNGFLNQATCLGDILNAAGYQQVFVGGASLEFSGKGQFLESHQYNRVLGRKALLARLDDANYHTGWGLYDDSLFDIARDEFTRLAAGQEPFNLTLLTIDTHSPGKPSASCLPFSEADNSILDAVYCTDQLLSGFLAFLKDQSCISRIR
ncbi:MAG: sulfatase-like hydrolase/transferase [Candidatus Azotimanducaceae bacterium WSBS_2022_MAG_OTU7]